MVLRSTPVLTTSGVALAARSSCTRSVTSKVSSSVLVLLAFRAWRAARLDPVNSLLHEKSGIRYDVLQRHSGGPRRKKTNIHNHDNHGGGDNREHHSCPVNIQHRYEYEGHGRAG